MVGDQHAKTIFFAALILHNYPSLSAARLSERKQSTTSLGQQAQLLTESLCPEAEDPGRCEADIEANWPHIGRAM
jgi:hypothetical protein